MGVKKKLNKSIYDDIANEPLYCRGETVEIISEREDETYRSNVAVLVEFDNKERLEICSSFIKK